MSNYHTVWRVRYQISFYNFINASPTPVSYHRCGNYFWTFQRACFIWQQLSDAQAFKYFREQTYILSTLTFLFETCLNRVSNSRLLGLVYKSTDHNYSLEYKFDTWQGKRIFHRCWFTRPFVESTNAETFAMEFLILKESSIRKGRFRTGRIHGHRYR